MIEVKRKFQVNHGMYSNTFSVIMRFAHYYITLGHDNYTITKETTVNSQCGQKLWHSM